jgi:ubiquinone/menaquinone biosynthesis C-methylase UbiE
LSDKNKLICPVELAGSLDNKIRRWIQKPQKILKPYIEEGMTVLDVGCGPGFFTIDMALMVGQAGRVIASDLQEGMLQKLRDKIQGTELEERITLHKSEQNKLGVSGPVDFVLLFYMVHEVPKKKNFFNEIITLLKPKGQTLLVEPPFHVSKSEFEKTVNKAREVGFTTCNGPKMLFSKTKVLQKG